MRGADRRVHRGAHARGKHAGLRRRRGDGGAGLRHRSVPRRPACHRARDRRRCAGRADRPSGDAQHHPAAVRHAGPAASAGAEPRRAHRRDPRATRRRCTGARPAGGGRGDWNREASMTRYDLPVWRSLLFVPVTQRRFVDGAARRGADAIILDLEDSVAASEKERARTLVPEAAAIVSRGGADVVVRLNRPVRMTVRDLEAVIGTGVQAVALPKAESADHVRLVAEIIDELEVERGIPLGTTKMLAMVETASAFFHIAEIARAHPRPVALNLGAEDFATSAGILPEAEALTMPKPTAVFSARAAGIMPMGFIGSIAEFHDLDAFRETIRRSRRFGFVGASVIHPSQIAILNDEFRPSAAEIDHASRVVAAYEKAFAEGVGAVTVDGKMIDVPVVERAKLLLEREAAIAARETKKQATGGGGS